MKKSTMIKEILKKATYKESAPTGEIVTFRKMLTAMDTEALEHLLNHLNSGNKHAIVVTKSLMSSFTWSRVHPGHEYWSEWNREFIRKGIYPRV